MNVWPAQFTGQSYSEWLGKLASQLTLSLTDLMVVTNQGTTNAPENYLSFCPLASATYLLLKDYNSYGYFPPHASPLLQLGAKIIGDRMFAAVPSWSDKDRYKMVCGPVSTSDLFTTKFPSYFIDLRTYLSLAEWTKLVCDATWRRDSIQASVERGKIVLSIDKPFLLEASRRMCVKLGFEPTAVHTTLEKNLALSKSLRERQ